MPIRVLLVACIVAALTAEASAYEVYGAIGDKWRQLGAASGPLGEARTDELDAARGGRFNEFQHGFIYWHPSLGAHAVYGAIGAKWNLLGRERGFGYPTTDESPARNGGRFNDFENGGSIYWHPATGAHAVYGAIRGKWHQLGREGGPLGYPVTDELPAVNGGRHTDFQSGMIYWHPAFGAYAVYGRIGQKWIELGRDQGVCGYPTSDEYDFDDGRDTGEYGIGQRFRRSNFANGYIIWSKRRDQVFPHCGATPPSRPQPIPPSESCSVSVTVVNRSCLNADGTPSTILAPGTVSAAGCGADLDRARARAKLSFQQFGCLSEGDDPSPGCCTYSEQAVQGCLCR